MRYLVALDGSRDAAAGLEWTAALPLGAADELVLATVVDARAEPAWLRHARRIQRRQLDVIMQAGWAARRTQARRLLADPREEAAGPPEPGVRQVVRRGDPVREIDRTASEVGADLVVVGARGHGRVAGVLLGSVARALLGVLDRPLVVVRRPIVDPDPVLLAIDGSPNADAAVACVAGLPWLARASITILVVVEAPGGVLAAPYPGPSAGRERALAASVASSAAERLARPERRVDPRIESGSAASRIVEVAAELSAGLVVVGTRGRGGLTERLVGGVAQAVIAAAGCSVLAVPPRVVSAERQTP